MLILDITGMEDMLANNFEGRDAANNIITSMSGKYVSLRIQAEKAMEHLRYAEVELQIHIAEATDLSGEQTLVSFERVLQACICDLENAISCLNSLQSNG